MNVLTIIKKLANLNTYKGFFILRKQHHSFQKKQFIESIDYCNQLIQLNKHAHTGYYLKAESLIELKLYEEARENLSIARRYTQNLFFKTVAADVELLICASYKKERNLKEAVTGAQKILETYPKYVPGYLFLARIKEEKSHYATAIEIIKTGLLHVGNHSHLLNRQSHLADVYTQDMRYKRVS